MQLNFAAIYRVFTLKVLSASAFLFRWYCGIGFRGWEKFFQGVNSGRLIFYLILFNLDVKGTGDGC